MATPTFNPDNWRWQCLNDFVAFKTLCELVENDSAIASHLDSMNVISVDGEDVPADFVQQLRESKLSDVQQLVGHFGALTVVSLCTTFEVAAREFFGAWFYQKPAHLHDYVAYNSIKGGVSLPKILQHESKEELLISLAEDAAAVAVQGKYARSLARSSSLSKHELPPGLCGRITSLQTSRNKIVHEKCKHSGNLKEVSSAHDVVSDAIMFLAKVAHDSGVPGAYSCINPVQMVPTNAFVQARSDA